MSSEQSQRLTLSIVLGVGLVLELWLWSRSVWVYPDQARLLSRALDWLETGRLSATGKATTNGFREPAGLLQLVVGVPLRVWPHVLAPGLLVLISHVAALAVLLPTLARLLDWRCATAFAAVFWLAPRRLYLSTYVWEPNYLFLLAALHLWATARLREEARVWPSFVLGLSIVSGPQFHLSGLTLLFATALLWLRRHVRLHCLGFTGGGLVAALPAVPWLTLQLTEERSTLNGATSLCRRSPEASRRCSTGCVCRPPTSVDD